MSLVDNSDEQRIWNFLQSKIKNAYGTAGLMGNLYAESGLRSNNLQNSYEKSLGYSDEAYTAAVDNGSYTNFVQDKAGYGLAQWTYWSRKQNLYNFVKGQNKSIGDLEAQLNFLWKELSEGYKGVLTDLQYAATVKDASNSVLLKFERPADQSVSVQNKRASFGQTYFDKYGNTSGSQAAQVQKEGITMSKNSSLVDITMLSPNHSGKRTHAVDRITPHCVVGQLTAEGIGKCFPAGRQASCNYGIGTEGKVCLIVDETNRSWCSSSNANDQRAITIECASDRTEPYAFNDKVYNKLIDLCTDICKRYGKNTLLWIADKDKALNYNPKSNEMLLTVHRWFANKSCPGNWMFARMGDLAEKVTKRLGGSAGSTTTSSSNSNKPTTSSATTNKNFPATPFTADVLVSDLNIRKTPNGALTGKTTGKGKFTITEVSNGWGKLKSGAGYIYLENASYVKISTTTAGSTQPAAASKPASKFPYVVQVTTGALNYRQGPGTNYKVNGTIRDRGRYTIIDEQNGWGLLKAFAKNRNGWISLAYTKKI